MTTKAELEDSVKERDRRIAELKAEKDEQADLIRRQGEAIDRAHEMIDQWIGVFDMQINDSGKYVWDRCVDEAQEWHDKYVALLREWNAAVADFNAMYAEKRSRGRPLQANETEIARVRQLHGNGRSLRGIVEDTALSLQTVRTIIDKDVMLDRGSRRILERVAPDHLREKLYRARRDGKKALPRRIDGWLKTRIELHQEAKGLK